MEVRYPLARVLGNAGIFFITPYAGSTLAGVPSIETALWTMILGLVASASREAIEYGKQKEGYNDTE